MEDSINAGSASRNGDACVLVEEPCESSDRLPDNKNEKICVLYVKKSAVRQFFVIPVANICMLFVEYAVNQMKDAGVK